MEIWKDIAGFEGRYEVSNLGRVRSYLEYGGTLSQTPHLRKPYSRKDGYQSIALHKEGKWRKATIHRLVLETFVGRPCEKQECRHLDNDPANNNLVNLRWGTHQDNITDKISNKTVKLSVSMVKAIRELQRRNCPVTVRRLAEYFNVSKTTIREVHARTTWNFV